MTSKAPSVAAYLAELPEERRGAIERLRYVCRQTLDGYEECMEYGMPCYKRNGAIEVGFASQRRYISLYMMKRDVVDEFRPLLPAASIGKGCIRFSRPERIDFEILARLLKRHVESPGAPC